MRAARPTVALCGSLGATASMWEPQVAVLADRADVLVIDHPGHGARHDDPGSPHLEDLAEEALVAVRARTDGSVHWLGLSLGAMVGMWLAAHRPEAIDRLVVLASSAHLPPATAWRDRAALVLDDGMEAVADAVLARWFTRSFTAGHPEIVARHRSMLTSVAPEGYASCCRAIAGMDLRPDLGRITAPTLVVGGLDDPATPPDHARALASSIAGGRLELLAPGAHLLNVERAAEVTELVLDHLLLARAPDRSRS